MATEQQSVRVMRWTGGQHPTVSTISRTMQKEGLRPFLWENSPNYRYAVRSHNYKKIMYVVEGVLEFTFPDSNQRVKLKTGDRVEIPAGVRHSAIVGSTGAKCLEAAQ
ncbi:MAG: cupin domain-containing protein [Pleurocapsa minor GSE-CHR-MK-17-07R]|nr:cupin domain-containing protein [Pleurocapsa minor GSE-CHR-MK 17-07R]